MRTMFEVQIGLGWRVKLTRAHVHQEAVVLEKLLI